MLQACCSPVSCDTLSVYDGGDSAKPLLRSMCGTQHKPLVSSSNKVFIEFKSDGSIPIMDQSYFHYKRVQVGK